MRRFGRERERWRERELFAADDRGERALALEQAWRFRFQRVRLFRVLPRVRARAHGQCGVAAARQGQERLGLRVARAAFPFFDAVDEFN